MTKGTKHEAQSQKECNDRRRYGLVSMGFCARCYGGLDQFPNSVCSECARKEKERWVAKKGR